MKPAPMTVLYPLARTALFALDAEVAHDLALHSLQKLGKLHLAGLLGRRLSASRIHRRNVCGLTIETSALMADPRGLARRTSRNRSPGVTRTGPLIFARRTSFSAFRY